MNWCSNKRRSLPKLQILFGIVIQLTVISLCSAESAAHLVLRVHQARTAEEDPKSVSDFCWLDSYGRGVGDIPDSCESGHTRIGLLCYPDCPTGYSRFGFDCHSDCPSDFRYDGLFCRKAEYGRGAGYPWKFGDGLNDDGMFSRCEEAEGKGNCEKWGAVVYPKCKPGYDSFGCCICRPQVPDCSSLGLNDGIDLSCAKKIIIGSPSLGICGEGNDRDAGLCYPKCRQGFNGIGPVCWGEAPPGWSSCGMGAARSTEACTIAVSNQVISCGKLALFVASLGTSSTAQAVQAPAEASKVQKLKDSWAAIQDLPEVQNAKKAFDAANAAKTTYTNIDNLMSKDVITEEDYIRMAATMAAILDPSGVSSVIAAFTYPKCDKIVGK